MYNLMHAKTQLLPSRKFQHIKSSVQIKASNELKQEPTKGWKLKKKFKSTQIVKI